MYFGRDEIGLRRLGMPSGLGIDTTSIQAFKDFIAKDFEAEYLLLVANQFGNNKVCLYAFGKSKTADYTAGKRRSTTRPTTAPSQ